MPPRADGPGPELKVVPDVRKGDFGELEDEGVKDREERCCPRAEEGNDWSRFEPVLSKLGQNACGGKGSLKS